MVRSVRFMTVIAVVFALLVAAGAVYAQGPGGGRRGGAFGRGGDAAGLMLRGLDLSEAQRQQIQAITEQYHQQVLAVLTPEQQQLVQQRRAQAEARIKQRLDRLQQRQQQ